MRVLVPFPLLFVLFLAVCAAAFSLGFATDQARAASGRESVKVFDSEEGWRGSTIVLRVCDGTTAVYVLRETAAGKALAVVPNGCPAVAR